MALQVERSRRARVQHTRERRQAEIAARRKQRLDALPAVLNDNMVLLFAEWCALGGFSQRTGRRILATPGGPTVTQISPKRIGVTVKHNREWQASRERRCEPNASRSSSTTISA